MNTNAIKTEEVFKVDKQIDDLVSKIELLSYVNPTNTDSEKQRFFDSKYTVEPVFTYPEIDFDRFKLHRALFSQPIETIQDITIRNFYEDIIYAYSGLIKCIETIGEGEKFYFNSLHSFGTPTEIDVENAKFILHFSAENESNNPNFQPNYTARETAELFKDYAKRYGFSFQIDYSKNMSAIAMVLSNKKMLLLKENHVFSNHEIGVLTNHEIGVHMVTSINASIQPLKIVAHGFPNYDETQEGLAVFSEYMSNNLTVRRLRELALRVIAVDSLAKGYSFSRTFRLLHNEYEIDADTAFKISVRAHRGGGFTKDYLYLTGLKKVYKYYTQGKDLKTLLCGKISLNYMPIISYLKESKLILSAKYITDSYAENNNTNTTVEFILKNLK